jgi:hypothetical protein
MSFFKKLIIADKYSPESQFTGKAILIKALKNKFSETLGDDYSLSQVTTNFTHSKYFWQKLFYR